MDIMFFIIILLFIFYIIANNLTERIHKTFYVQYKPYKNLLQLTVINRWIFKLGIIITLILCSLLILSIVNMFTETNFQGKTVFNLISIFSIFFGIISLINSWILHKIFKHKEQIINNYVKQCIDYFEKNYEYKKHNLVAYRLLDEHGSISLGKIKLKSENNFIILKYFYFTLSAKEIHGRIHKEFHHEEGFVDLKAFNKNTFIMEAIIDY